MKINKIAEFSVGPVLSSLLGLITLPIVAWFFSPDDIGRLTMLHVAISFSLLLFSLGLDQAYVREFHVVDNKPSLFKLALFPGLILLSFGSIILLLLPWSLSEFIFGISSSLLSYLLILSIFFAFISRFLSLILRMQERGLAYSMSQVLPKLLFLILLGAYVYIGAEAVFTNLMLANFISLFVVFVVFAWATREQWLVAINTSIDQIKQRQMIRYALPLIGSGIAFWGLTAMDKIFLRSISTFEELGIYSISVSFASAALVFQAIFTTIWAPTVYKWAEDGSSIDKIKKTIEYVSLIVLLIWSLAGLFSWVVIFILPPEYVNVPKILLVTMAYPLFYTLAEATGVGIGIQRKTEYALLAALIALLANLGGNLIFIPIYGAAGAAISTGLAFLIFLIIKTESSISVWSNFPRLKIYTFIISFFIVSVIINIFNFDLFIVPILFTLLFILVIYFFKNIFKDFLKNN